MNGHHCSRFPHVNFRLLGAFQPYVIQSLLLPSGMYITAGISRLRTVSSATFRITQDCQVFLPFQLTWSCSLGRFASPILRYPSAACSPSFPVRTVPERATDLPWEQTGRAALTQPVGKKIFFI